VKQLERPPFGSYFNDLGSAAPRAAQDLVLAPIRRAGVEVPHRQTDWFSDTPYAQDWRQEVENTVSMFGVKSHGLLLIGAGAGWSRAVNVFAELAPEYKKLWVVGLCGRSSSGPLIGGDTRTLEKEAGIDKRHDDEKNHGEDTPEVQGSTQYLEAIDHLQTIALPKLTPEIRQRMFTLHAAYDERVPFAAQVIEGVPHRRTLMPFHKPGIWAAGLMLPHVVRDLTHVDQPPFSYSLRPRL